MKHTVNELLSKLKAATTKEDFEAICKQIAELRHTRDLIGPYWLLENAFFERATKFYPSLAASKLSKEIQRQIEENIFAPARNIYPHGNIRSSLDYNLEWAYGMCFLNHMRHLCQDMESFILNYCNEDKDSPKAFRVIPLHVARFLSSVDACTYYGNYDDFNVSNYRCRAFQKGNDIYIYIPEPAEHSRHVAVMTIGYKAQELRKKSYSSTVCLQKGDNCYNTVTISKNDLADNFDALSELLAARYPNATYKILSHSYYRELPNICQDVWRNRFKCTRISQPTGFRLAVMEYSDTNIVAYIVLPEYH